MSRAATPYFETARGQRFIVTTTSGGKLFVAIWENDRTSDRGALVEQSGCKRSHRLANGTTPETVSDLRTPADTCYCLQPTLHDKEEVDGSSPSEGFRKPR